MRLLVTVILLKIACGNAMGEEMGSARALRVSICVATGTMTPNDANQVRFATQQASRVFATAGVVIDWQIERTCDSRTDSIKVRFNFDPPEESSAGALAYARPFKVFRIEIFYDRVMKMATSYTVAGNRFLAYVMVHEITHVLQSVDTHSEAGMMRARWTTAETFRMRSGTLGFTEQDVELIYLGNEARQALQLLASGIEKP